MKGVGILIWCLRGGRVEVGFSLGITGFYIPGRHGLGRGKVISLAIHLLKSPLEKGAI